jgi:peptidoglycan hydrolase-like protein with peptidoglycan-binding domain
MVRSGVAKSRAKAWPYGAALALAAVTSALVAGAGPAFAADGGQVWTAAGCGSCHTLNVTGSRTRVGPNLDEVAPTAVQVAAQVRSGGGGMPTYASKLTAEQIDAVAGFVAANAGRLPGSQPIAGTITPTVTGPLPAAQPWVVSLQRKLAALGFFSGPQTGVYGPVTTAAVIAFQSRAGLKPDGKWGPSSQAALERSVAAGSVTAAAGTPARGTTTATTTTAAPGTTTTAAAALPAPQAWVKSLQQKLARLGSFSGPANGVLGPVTTAAIKSFQAKSGLKADGLWGPSSQAALVKALAAHG